MVTGITKAKRKAAAGGDAAPIIHDGGIEDLVINPGIGADSSQVTLRASDPEGFPIVFSADYLADSSKSVYTNDSSNLPPFLLHPAQVSLGSADSAGIVTATYRFLTVAATANAIADVDSDGNGNSIFQSFRVRLSANDGIRTATQSFNLRVTNSVDVNFTGVTGFSAGAGGTFINEFKATSVNNPGIIGPALRNGKRYMEIVIDNPSTYLMFGLGKIGTSQNWGSTNGTYWYKYGSAIYGAGGSNVAAGMTYASNDRLMFAWDTDQNKCWFGKNGTWGSSMNPNSDTGYNIVGSFSAGDLDDKVGIAVIGGNGSAYGLDGVIKKSGDLAYTIPTGFSSQ